MIFPSHNVTEYNQPKGIKLKMSVKLKNLCKLARSIKAKRCERSGV
jgi:hypothetical protein